MAVVQPCQGLSRAIHKMELYIPVLGICAILCRMIVIGTDIVEAYFKSKAGHRGIKAARAQYDAWLAIAGSAEWRTPEEVKKSHPKASILKGGRVVFNIKANDFRLVALIQYMEGVLMIRFFGSHEEYDKIDAETV
jgi:mRNA interferase HigB